MLNPHLHGVFLDGVYVQGEGDALVWHALPRLRTTEVADVLHVARVRIVRHLVRRGVLGDDADPGVQGDLAEREPALAQLAAAAVSGVPPAGPELRRRLEPVLLRGARDARIRGPLSVEEGGFSLHAATRAGGADPAGREALLRYVLRPPVSQERVVPGPDGLVRISLKKPFSDGTVAVDMDPLSLLCRLAAAVPAPRFHTVRYAGVLGAASKVRSRVLRKPQVPDSHDKPPDEPDRPKRPRARYIPWAQLLKRTFALDVEACPSCQGRMKLVALVQDPKAVARFLRHLGEPAEPPPLAPARGPPFWKSRVFRRRPLAPSSQAQMFDV